MAGVRAPFLAWAALYEPQCPRQQNGQKEQLSFSQLLLKMMKAEYGRCKLRQLSWG